MPEKNGGVSRGEVMAAAQLILSVLIIPGILFVANLSIENSKEIARRESTIFRMEEFQSDWSKRFRKLSDDMNDVRRDVAVIKSKVMKGS